MIWRHKNIYDQNIRTDCKNIDVLLVIEQNIRALDVSMQKVLLVAVIQPFQQLSHERLDVALVEMDQPGLEQTHQVVVHVFKYKIESTWDERKKIESS